MDGPREVGAGGGRDVSYPGRPLRGCFPGRLRLLPANLDLPRPLLGRHRCARPPCRFRGPGRPHRWQVGWSERGSLARSPASVGLGVIVQDTVVVRDAGGIEAEPDQLPDQRSGGTGGLELFHVLDPELIPAVRPVERVVFRTQRAPGAAKNLGPPAPAEPLSEGEVSQEGRDRRCPDRLRPSSVSHGSDSPDDDLHADPAPSSWSFHGPGLAAGWAFITGGMPPGF